jgi:alpha-ribazole phosphatase
MTTYKLHLIRHGLTELQTEGRYVGRLDVPLSDTGRAELVRLSEQGGYPQVEAVYCCPLLRSRQTAELLYPHLPITVVEDLVEMALGDFEGMRFDELAADPAYESWMADSHRHAPPGGESGATFAARIADGLGAVFMDMQRERCFSAACVVSGGVLMALLRQHTLPEQPLSAFAVNLGEGYTLSLSTYLWGGHRLVEIEARLPAAAV